MKTTISFLLIIICILLIGFNTFTILNYQDKQNIILSSIAIGINISTIIYSFLSIIK